MGLPVERRERTELGHLGHAQRTGYGPAAQPDQPVWVWNASMSGSRADYPLAHWDATWPTPIPDLVLLSYGHNYTLDPEQIEPQFDALHARLAASAALQ